MKYCDACQIPSECTRKRKCIKGLLAKEQASRPSSATDCSASECQCPPCVKYREYLAWKKSDDAKHAISQMTAIAEENRHLKDMLATLSKTHAKDMQRLSDMIDLRQGALRHISEIIEEKNAAGQDLLCGSTAYKSVRRWASDFLQNH